MANVCTFVSQRFIKPGQRESWACPLLDIVLMRSWRANSFSDTYTTNTCVSLIKKINIFLAVSTMPLILKTLWNWQRLTHKHLWITEEKTWRITPTFHSKQGVNPIYLNIFSNFNVPTEAEHTAGRQFKLADKILAFRNLFNIKLLEKSNSRVIYELFKIKRKHTLWADICFSPGL